MNWLEKKVLLILIKRLLKEASTMTLSWHLFWQALAMALQGANQFDDSIPPKYKPFVALALGLIQAALAWHAHYSNPDGTPASVAYVPKPSGDNSTMKVVLFLLSLCLVGMSHSASAQDASNLYAAGVSYNNSGSPSIAGTGLYAHLLADTGTYAFTVVDALPNSFKPFTVTSNFGAGIAQKVVTIGKVPLYIPTSAGVSFSGSNTGWSWSTGVLASVKVKNNWRLMPNVRMVKSSVSNGTGYQVIVGFLVGYAK